MSKIEPSHPREPVSQPKKVSINRRALGVAEIIGSFASEKMPKGLSTTGSLKGRVSKKHPNDSAATCAKGICSRNPSKSTSKKSK